MFVFSRDGSCSRSQPRALNVRATQAAPAQAVTQAQSYTTATVATAVAGELMGAYAGYGGVTGAVVGGPVGACVGGVVGAASGAGAAMVGVAVVEGISRRARAAFLNRKSPQAAGDPEMRPRPPCCGARYAMRPRHAYAPAE